VRRRWTALSVERKQDLMLFDDPCLVERVKTALQALFQKQEMMNSLGIKLTAAADPFAESSLFTTAFEFTWQIARSARNPRVILVDPMSMPVLVMKTALLDSDLIFREMSKVLPDFLSDRSSRLPLPKARWKDLWVSEPASVVAMEQQLVKLVEQVLWFMGTDPGYEAATTSWTAEEDRCTGSDTVPFEPWMECGESTKAKGKTGDAKKRKKPHKKHRTPSAAASSSEVASACSAEATLFEEEDEGDEDITLTARQTPVVLEDGQALSSDESVGSGTMHFAGEVSCAPTASSTPALAHAKSKMPSRWSLNSPVHSPLARHQAMSSKQLVCYIWNQASQCPPCSGSPRSTTGPSQAQSSSAQATTPFARGQWTTPASSSSSPGTPSHPPLQPPRSSVLSAVVRKTFVDIDDPSEYMPEAMWARTSRSLSPVRSSFAWDANDPRGYLWRM